MDWMIDGRREIQGYLPRSWPQERLLEPAMGAAMGRLQRCHLRPSWALSWGATELGCVVYRQASPELQCYAAKCGYNRVGAARQYRSGH
jgi:hypothetical protein